MVYNGHLREAYRELPILQRAHPSGDDFVLQARAQLRATPNVQFFLENPEGACPGGLVLIEGEDALVGRCMTTMHIFISHPARGSTLIMRALIRLALEECRARGIRWFLLPNAGPNGVSTIRYMEVKQ